MNSIKNYTVKKTPLKIIKKISFMKASISANNLKTDVNNGISF